MTHPNKRDIHSKAFELNQKRKEYNQEILRRLTAYLQANPSIRFNQALINMNIISFGDEPTGRYQDNEYYTEPEEVLKRMK